ncbi:MAG: ATP-binding protein, partial [Polyangiales bacterium]
LFSRCNSAVVHATDEQALLDEICRIAVEDAGYRMAWVGRADHDAACSVRPIAFAGQGAGFLERVRVSWADDQYGHGTAGTAIRTRRPGVGRDLLANPNFSVWREALRDYGFKSAIAMPLQFAHEVHGVLVIYASEPDAFDTTEVSLLEELGGNVSHGLLALRSRRKLAEAMVELERAHRELEDRVAQRTHELEESREKYRELVEHANSIILRMDTRGRITFANEFAVSFFGYPELVGRSAIGTIVPETESTGRDLALMMEDLTSHPDRFAHNENENVRRDGERVWIAWTNKPILDRAERLVGVLAIGNDITALKRTEAELVRAKEAAESADRLKSAFLATMSHELRTPLNSIIGFTGILLQGLAGPLNEEQRKQLGMVQGSSRHLLALINDVLDISKIEAGQLTIAREPFDVSASLDQVVRTLTPAADAKGLTLRTEIAGNLGSMAGDKRRFEQVVINLLGNAVKFTERGVVTLRCSMRQGNLVVAVQDTGIGIPREQFSQLFRPFHQVDTGTARKHEGTGLGLSICKRLVELMGGNITVESTLGVGSTFTVTVPLAVLRGGEP